MLLLPHRHWPVSELPSSPVVVWFCCSCCSAWIRLTTGQWHDSTSWHTLPWSGPGPVADAGPRVWGSAPVPGGQPLFLCSPGGHCAHAMLAMILGLRGCTAIRLIPAAAVAAAESVGGLEAMGNGKRYQAQARLRPACPDTPHIPHTPHPHIYTPTPALRMQPHWQQSWPAGQALCPASPEPTSGWAAGGFYSASGSWIGYPQCLYLVRCGLWCWPAGLKSCHQSAGPSCHADWPSCTWGPSGHMCAWPAAMALQYHQGAGGTLWEVWIRSL